MNWHQSYIQHVWSIISLLPHMASSSHPDPSNNTRRFFPCPLIYQSYALQRPTLDYAAFAGLCQNEGLVRVGKRGQQSRRLLRWDSCSHGMVWYLVHCKAWGTLRQGSPLWTSPLHQSIILQCLHLIYLYFSFTVQKYQNIQANMPARYLLDLELQVQSTLQVLRSDPKYHIWASPRSPLSTKALHTFEKSEDKWRN